MKIFRVFTAILALFILPSNVCAAESKVMIVATIDGEPLTTTDFEKYIATKERALSRPINYSLPEVKQYVKDMVVEALLEKEAERSGAGIEESEIEAYIQEIKTQNSVDDAGFIRLLKARGLTKDEYRDQVKKDIIRTRVLSTQIRSKITVLDEDILRVIDRSSSSSEQPQENVMRVYQIFVPEEAATNTKSASAIAKDMREKIKKGEGWSSVGGKFFTDLGHVQVEDLLDELQQPLAELGEEKVSEVVEVSKGAYLIGVQRDASSFEAIDPVLRENVRKRLYDQKFQEALKKYINEELPQKYFVEYKL